MAIVIAAALLAVGLVVAALLYARAVGGGRGGSAGPAPAPPLARGEVEAELLERRGEIVRIEERVISKEEAIDAKLAELSRRDQRLDDRERELEHQRELLEERKREHLRELERVAGLSASQAKQVLLKEVEDQARHDAAKVLRQIDEETKLQAERRVRNILSVCMGRLAATHQHLAGLDLLGAQQLHDVGDLARVQFRKQRHARHHVPGDDEVPPVDLLGEGGRDDADRQRDHDEAEEDGSRRDDLAQRGDRDHVAVSDRAEGDDGPPHGVRDRAELVRLGVALDEMHHGRGHDCRAEQDDSATDQGAPLGVEHREERAHAG